MMFAKGGRKFAISGAILALIATAAYAAGGFDRLKDNVLIGQGTSSDKVIDFDTGGGANDTKLTATSAGTLKVDIAGSTRATFSSSGLTTTIPSLLAAGSASAPAFSFSADSNTGMYSAAADDLGFSSGGTLRLDLSTTALTSTLPYRGSAGSAAAPSLSFSGDSNTGLYSASADDLGFSSGGTLRLDLSTAALTSTVPHLGPAGSAGAPTYSFSGDPDTGLYSAGANLIGISSGGSQHTIFEGNGIETQNGTAADPAFTFLSDNDTGIYHFTTNSLGITAGGANVATFDSTGFLDNVDGTNSAPSLRWPADANTGVYHPSGNHVGVTSNGTEVVEFGPNGIASGTIADSSAMKWKVFTGTITGGGSVDFTSPGTLILSVEGYAQNNGGSAYSVIGTANQTWNTSVSVSNTVRLNNAAGSSCLYRVVMFYQ